MNDDNIKKVQQKDDTITRSFDTYKTPEKPLGPLKPAKENKESN